MAGVINTGTTPKALMPGLKVIWGRNYNDLEMEWPKLVDKMTSNKTYEEGYGITPFGLVPVKPEGAATQYDSEAPGFVTRIQNVAYALGYIVTREEMDDNQYREITDTRTTALARSFRITKEIVVANMYNRAFNNAYVGGDGVSLVNTAHPSPNGGSYSNRLSVDSDLNEAALEDMAINIQNAVDDRGLRIALKPKTLIIPVAEMFNARRILGGDMQAYTAGNTINAIKSYGLFQDVVVSHYLTSNHAWFVRTDIPAKQGIVLMQRVAAEFDKDNDFDTENMKFKGYERYGTGWFDPRAVYASNGP